jgi:hypothetical protein
MKKKYLLYFIVFSALAGMIVSGWDMPGEAPALSKNFTANPPPPDTPHGLIGSYYNGEQFDAYVATRIDSVIQFDWGNSGSPFPGQINHDHFSVRWVGYIKPPVTGTYTFHANSDDGGRLIIGGLDFLDYWGTCCNDFSATIFLKADSLYPFVFEMHQGTGGANAKYVEWEAPGLPLELVPNSALYAIAPPVALPKPDVSRDTAHGLIGYYYNDPNVSPNWFDTLVITRIDPQINFDWGNGSPIPPRIQTDYFSVRWVGFVRAPVTGTYTFHTWSDDGSRLWVAGQKIIDYWSTCCSDHAGTIDLNAGVLYPIVLEYHEIGGGAGVHYINWEAPGLPLENIPTNDYYTVKLSTVSPPLFYPQPGIYVDSVRVFMVSPTNGSQIHYTLDGSTPDENSPIDTGYILINKNTQIDAVAYHDGMVQSVMSSATYRIIPPLVSTPSFYPGQGIYGDSIKVVISTREDSTVIYYTLDGSTPDTTSILYSGPVEIDSTTRLKAFAVKSGMSPSNVASATYTFLPPAAAAPTFSVAAGNYNDPQTVSITSTTSGAIIHYVTGNDALNDASPVYSSPITIGKTTTLKAFAEKDGLRTSDVTIATYTIGTQQEKVDSPSFSLPGGHYNGIKQIAITTKTQGATIYYTTDGKTPDSNSNVYVAPVLIMDSMTLKAIATRVGMHPSDIISATYIISGAIQDTGAINDKLPVPKLTISPNPATDIARLTWTNMVYTLDGAYLTVTDSRGAIMQRINIKGGYTYYDLNTSTYSNGVYFVRIVSGNSILLGKLIIGR